MSQQSQPQPNDAKARHRAAYAWTMLVADAAALYLVLLFKKFGTRGKNATHWDGLAALLFYPYVLAQFWASEAQNLLTFSESFFLIYGSFLLLCGGHRLTSLFQRYVKRNYEHTQFVGVSIFETKGRDRNSALLCEIIAGLALAGAGFYLSSCIGAFLLASAIGLAIKNFVMIVEVQTLRDMMSNAEIESDWMENVRRN